MSGDPNTRLRDFFQDAEKPLVIGLGNEYMEDDGAGLLVVRQLASKEVTVLEAGRDLLGALYRLESPDHDRILIVDAANLGKEPGSFFVLEPEQIFEKNLSTHENNLGMAMALIRSGNPNAKVLYLGIQFGSMEMTDGMVLTKEMEEGVEMVVKLVSNVFDK